MKVLLRYLKMIDYELSVIRKTLQNIEWLIRELNPNCQHYHPEQTYTPQGLDMKDTEK